MRLFTLPLLITLCIACVAYAYGGMHALSLIAILSILEITLSFDNAIVNARTLRLMSAAWQQRFIMWGIPIAVFGTRFVLPILIVAAATHISPLAITSLALFDAPRYSFYVHAAHDTIAAFGGIFLLLVSLSYFFDTEKTTHWIRAIEQRTSSWGAVPAIEVIITLSILLVCAYGKHDSAAAILFAGLIGVISFMSIDGVMKALGVENTHTLNAGILSFIYLEILDAAFSLDGVVGAFAITSSIVTIIAGLCIGALFVRACTVHFVRSRALDSLVYLEHGAHWAIFCLALSMFVSLFVPVPEMVTGTVGIIFVGLSYLSSQHALQSTHANTTRIPIR